MSETMELESSTPSDLAQDEVESNVTSQPVSNHSKVKTIAIIVCITCSTGIGSFVSGLVIVGLPRIIIDLSIPPGLVLWPVSIFALTCGCTLLLCGSISDVFGSRITYLLGCLLQFCFTLGCGLAKTDGQLIVFRAFAGIASSFILPSAVKLINETFSPGRRRNMAFASMGGGQPIGWSLGLSLGGVITDKAGWRWGFYVASIISVLVLILSTLQLPKSKQSLNSGMWRQLALDIDWFGAIVASASIAMLSYVLAAVSGSTMDIHAPATIATLSIAIALIPVFVFWMGRQERIGRPALIPNSFWRNTTFTTICINVFLISGAESALEQMANLFFQDVQKLSPLEAALRFLPGPICGIFVNTLMGLLVHRVRADWIVIGTTTLACISPILFAVEQPNWTYWAASFLAILLNGFGSDGLFTISNLLITSMFPAKTQGLAGGVFNTISQIGISVALALVTLIANQRTAESGYGDKQSPSALLDGYRVSFWFLFALNGTSLIISLLGLRKIGKIGKKEE